MRQLDVWLNHSCVGVLSEGDDLWRFEYDAKWAGAGDAFDLAPGLPRAQQPQVDGGTNRPVQWYFDNLLPEEKLRELVLKDAGVQGGDDAFALLEYLGAESAGSLSLLPPGKGAPAGGDRQPLSDEDLSQRIRDLPRAPLSKGAPKRMSLAGAQNKLPVIYTDAGELFEPIGGEPSTHILKPNHTSDDYAGSVMNEFFTMTLADRVKLPVPRVYRRYVPEPVYIIERFDRIVEETGTRRRHIIDACQLLNKSRAFKTSARLDTLKAVVEACRNRAQARRHVFRWLVFCVLVGNDDNHLKNLSFLVDAEGIAVAPHYDLLSTATYHTKAFADERAIWQNVPMTVALPGVNTFAQVTRASLIEAGTMLGLPETLGKRLVDELLAAIQREVGKLAEELANNYDEHPKVRAEDRNIEGRVVRAIQHITIRDMLDRLG